MTITRVTMFKCPPEHIEKLLENYKTLSKSALKNGKPYILSLSVGPTHDDARNQGYTLVSKSEYASLADMKYYDEECEAHKVLKAAAKDYGLSGPPLTVYYEAAVAVSM